jgi:phosphoglycerol transferase MdoB-like AlkP superfamily enzyme
MRTLLLKMGQYTKRAIPWMGGPVCFMAFFIYGLVNNLSMSYMGNTSEKASRFILDNFLGTILLFLGKVLIVYIVISLVISGIIVCAIRSYGRLSGRTFSARATFLLNLFFTLIFSAATFFKGIILYPQVYMNNFHSKGAIHAAIFEFLTDHVNPMTLTVAQYTMAGAAVALIIAAGIRFYRKTLVCTTAGLAAITAVFLLATVSFGASVHTVGGKKNCIIIASDALRPDHLGAYGYPRDTSPALDKLIHRGISFSNAYIEVPRTFPSWVSILTGQYASTHGIRHMFPTSRDVNRNFSSIARILGNEGYETSVVTDYAGDIFTRIDLGFKNVDTPYFNFRSVIQQVILENHPFLLPFLTNKAGLAVFPVLRDSAYFCPPSLLRDRIIRAIDHAGNRPFFITTFFSSTHFPYAPPYPYYARYAKKGYNGPYRYFKQRIISLDGKGESAAAMKQEDIEQIHALYDAGIRAMDDAVGDIIAHLELQGKLDDTIIVILSDHGENLYEYEYGMGHGEHFRGRYATRIPLVFINPSADRTGFTVNQTVRHVDIAPTILSMLGCDIPPHTEGRSLLPLMYGKTDAPRVAFGETGIWFDNNTRDDLFFQKKRIMYPDITNLSEIDFNFDAQIVLNDDYRDIVNLAKHRYAFDGRYKLVYMPLTDHIEYELYDTLKDPEERENIAARDPFNCARMKKILFDWIARNNDVVIRNEYIFSILRY